MAVFDFGNRNGVSNSHEFLKERGIKQVETCSKPDSRYTNMLSIGYSLPKQSGIDDFKDYRNKYGCSRGVTRNEHLVLSPNKCASFGKVKSYGSITTVVNSVGLGA